MYKEYFLDIIYSWIGTFIIGFAISELWIEQVNFNWYIAFLVVVIYIGFDFLFSSIYFRKLERENLVDVLKGGD